MDETFIEIALAILGAVVAITITPLVVGAGIGMLLGASGLFYYATVIITACIIWCACGIIWREI